MARPRLQDVAVRAEVSSATVSRVVNDVPGVSDDTRRRVQSALRELGYGGVGIRGSEWRQGLIGLVVPELTNPVFPAFAEELESRLARRGCTTMLATARSGGTAEADYVEALLDRGIAGLVVVSGTHADPNADHGHYQHLADLGVGLVLVNGMPVDAEWTAPWSGVSIDHGRATGGAVTHLAQLGHTRIALAIGPHHHLPSREHVAGYRAAMEAHGLAPDLVSESVYGIEGGQAASRDLVEAGATAIVCSSDLMALGAIRAAQEEGLSVPGDLSVVGFDDAGPWTFTDPPLTSTRQPLGDMAQAITRLLLDGGGDGQRLWFRGELVVRGSTGTVSSDVLPALPRAPRATPQPGWATT